MALSPLNKLEHLLIIKKKNKKGKRAALSLDLVHLPKNN
jgi:hypothetical protein